MLENHKRYVKTMVVVLGFYLNVGATKFPTPFPKAVKNSAINEFSFP